MFGMLALFAYFFMGAIPTYAQTSAFVRVIHASPDVGTADVFVDGSVLLSSFQFGAVTDYVPVPPGPHKVQIALVGKGIGASVITQTLAVNPGVAYTVAAVGTQATGLGLEVFIDNNLIVGTTAKVRAYQLSPNAGTLNMATDSGNLFNGLTYQQASEYLAVPATSYTFHVTATNLSTSMPVSTTLKADTITSIFVVGLVNGSPNIQVVSAQTNGIPSMPGTGSNPATPPNHFPLWSPWFLGVLAVLVLGLGALSIGRDIIQLCSRP